jgi:hypothetical protein
MRGEGEERRVRREERVSGSWEDKGYRSVRREEGGWMDKRRQREHPP